MTAEAIATLAFIGLNSFNFIFNLGCQFRLEGIGLLFLFLLWFKLSTVKFNKFWLFYSNYPLIYIGIIYFLSAIFIYLLFLEKMNSNLILYHYDFLFLSNIVIKGEPKSIQISPYNSIKQIKYKYNFIKIYY